MKRSVLFTRFFSVVILTILITAVFTTVLYNYISRTVFTQIKENELLPKARALGHIVQSYRSGELQAGAMDQLLNSQSENSSLLGAYVLVTDEEGNPILGSEDLTEDQQLAMNAGAAAVLENGELRTGQIPSLNRTGMVGVGVPIVADGERMGAVLMLVPLFEAMVGMSSLNGALMISLLMVLPIVAVMVFYLIGRIVRPLRQMRDVALTMAAGDFSARADASQRGEIGQLARSLNYLSQELSKSMSALVLERNRLRQTVDGLREGIVAVDSLGRITHHNPALDGLFSALREERSGQADGRMRLIPDAQVWQDFDRAVSQGEGVVRPLNLTDRVIQVSVSPITDQIGSIAGAVGLFSDITESERLERTRRDYVANVSHELRTPLTAMRALIEPLSEGMVKDEETRRRYYNILLRETLRLTRLINDLMELSRLQSGQISPNLQVMKLDLILEDLSDKYAAVAEERGLTFACEIGRGDLPAVLANPDRVEQVLVILLDNAMKYTPEGGRVLISAVCEDARVTMCVRDTGVGIDPKDQACVFDRFYKVDRAHTSLGSGLGLSIASELVKFMGEKIWLESQKGSGTAFFFTLKRA